VGVMAARHEHRGMGHDKPEGPPDVACGTLGADSRGRRLFGSFQNFRIYYLLYL
jgi:hypothetical protein